MNQQFKFFCLILVSGMLISGCGPSAKEIEEKRVADSVNIADSLAMVGNVSNELKLDTRTPKDKQFIKTAETKFKVRNVRIASEKIEDLAVKYSGYLTYSNLRNNESDYSRIELSHDSVLVSKRIVVENDMVLRIPNEALDSLVRELNNLIIFLDYRIVKMDDVSFALLANQKASERLKEYDLRVKKHIGTKDSKLKETTTAEENILNRQIQADQLNAENLEIADQIRYCTLKIVIYQQPVLSKETQVLLNVYSYRSRLLTRIFDAVSDGWVMFENFVVFLFRIWWLIMLIIGGILVYRLWLKPRKNKLPRTGA